MLSAWLASLLSMEPSPCLGFHGLVAMPGAPTFFFRDSSPTLSDAHDHHGVYTKRGDAFARFWSTASYDPRQNHKECGNCEKKLQTRPLQQGITGPTYCTKLQFSQRGQPVIFIIFRFQPRFLGLQPILWQLSLGNCGPSQRCNVEPWSWY